MNKKLIIAFSRIIAVVMLTSLVAACSKATTEQGKQAETQQPSSQTSGAKIVDKPIKLTYWADMNPNASSAVKDLSEVLLYKEMEKRTNISIEFRHPPVGQAKDQFGVLVASRDLPDIIEGGWNLYPGDRKKAAEDGLIIKLNDLIEKNSPNLKQILDSNVDISRMVKSDDGIYYSFPALSMNKIRVYGGPILRKDFLDELGLQVPETIDEWENMLRQFKDKKGLKAPLSFMQTPNNNILSQTHVFVGAYGLTIGYCIDNGKIKYGPAEANYKEFFKLMNKWYKEGLLDPDCIIHDQKSWEAKITTDKTGAFIGYIGGNLGNFLSAMKDKNPKFDLVAAQFPVLKKGDQPKFVPRDWEVSNYGYITITTANKYPKETAKWVDYFYSQEGHILKNFGVEGETFKMENGYPRYTELITKNPDKLSLAHALGKYTRANYPTVGNQDDRYLEQYYQYEQQKEAAKLWSKYADNAKKSLMPPGVTLTTEENNEFGKIMNDINIFKDEMYFKFITGTESIDNFDKYIAQLKKMNIDRAIQIEQTAYDRYLSKK